MHWGKILYIFFVCLPAATPEYALYGKTKKIRSHIDCAHSHDKCDM